MKTGWLLSVLCLALSEVIAADLFQPNIAPELAAKVDEAKNKQMSGAKSAEVESALLSVLDQNPDYYRARMNLGLLYQSQGKTEQAINNLESALKLRQKLKIDDRSIFTSLGWTYLNAGQIAKAEPLLLEAWKEKDKNEGEENQRILNNLAYLYLQKEDYPKARQFIKSAQETYQSPGAEKVLRLIEESEQRKVQKIRIDIAKNPAEHSRLIDDNTKIRLIFFVTDEKQRDLVWSRGAVFLAGGFYPANVVLNPSKIPDSTEVRYFQPKDEGDARQVDAFLEEIGIAKHRPSLVIDSPSIGTGRKLQVWLRKDDFR